MAEGSQPGTEFTSRVNVGMRERTARECLRRQWLGRLPPGVNDGREPPGLIIGIYQGSKQGHLLGKSEEKYSGFAIDDQDRYRGRSQRIPASGV
jgi:hypothetical protein